MQQERRNLKHRTVALPPHLWEALSALARVNSRTLTAEFERAVRFHVNADPETVEMDRERREARDLARKMLEAASEPVKAQLKSDFPWLQGEEEAQ